MLRGGIVGVVVFVALAVFWTFIQRCSLPGYGCVVYAMLGWFLSPIVAFLSGWIAAAVVGQRRAWLLALLGSTGLIGASYGIGWITRQMRKLWEPLPAASLPIEPYLVIAAIAAVVAYGTVAMLLRPGTPRWAWLIFVVAVAPGVLQTHLGALVHGLLSLFR
ncbi:hypothetical protein GCM10012275_06520 [Longimycelium tulufanense]|uniref:Uncharacterized protein n=1 Tax=Longimycelium tulufanense TaxID=907463 RepID=A0A8J3CA35_9PSEU|nr:hypothetical protein [Longimycelium tulufanense]GGM38190.1 hypothetical protein GCM10012275_06520 [Longimycelium tulufanense]